MSELIVANCKFKQHKAADSRAEHGRPSEKLHWPLGRRRRRRCLNIVDNNNAKKSHKITFISLMTQQETIVFCPKKQAKQWPRKPPFILLSPK